MILNTKHALAVSFATMTAFASVNALALDIDSEYSQVSLVSTKVLADGTQSVAEVFTFDSLSGSVGDDGAASIAIDLASISTGVDIRNERMGEFFFETSKYPEATITAQIPDDAFANGSRTMDIDVSVNMHGSDSEYSVPVHISSDDAGVTVVATKPVLVDATSFELSGGLAKLGELAGLLHIPATVPVSFNLAFTK